MSTEAMTRLIKALKKDEALRSKFYGTKTPEEAAAVVAADGYEVSAEELTAWTGDEGELSEDELLSIGGGADLPTLNLGMVAGTYAGGNFWNKFFTKSWDLGKTNRPPPAREG